MTSDYNCLSDFITRTEVMRKDEIAVIVVKWLNGFPIRLFGFVTNAYLSDFEIWEQGYLYYLALVEHINKL